MDVEESSSTGSAMDKSSVEDSLSERGPDVDQCSYAQLTEKVDEGSGMSVTRFTNAQNAAVSSAKEDDDDSTSCSGNDSSDTNMRPSWANGF